MTQQRIQQSALAQQSGPTKRQSCLRCLRSLSTCLCKHIQLVSNYVEVIILQHPIEVNQVKNTGYLLRLCLQNSQLHVGEQFDDDFFGCFNMTANTDRSIYDVLLYPETAEEKSLGIASPPIIDNERLTMGDNLNTASRIRLWVLDATWRKSRKMLYLNHALQTMPRLKLHNCAPTIYTIRKAHCKNQLSTFEASCYALHQLEQNSIDYTPALTSFADFIAQQKTFIPSPLL